MVYVNEFILYDDDEDYNVYNNEVNVENRLSLSECDIFDKDNEYLFGVE